MILHIPQDICQQVRDYLAALNGRNVVINIFAGHQDRSMSQAQLATLLVRLCEDYPDVNIILLDHRNEIRIPLPEKVCVNPFKTLHHCMGAYRRGRLSYLAGYLGGPYGGGVEKTAYRGLQRCADE
ncbi:LOS biosynthesis enzyme LBGB [Klebsiella michiganensis]|uniref:LOS biosynthesis enzyme LBGB n=1 Tax=Klebsiella michiganensis TaxID=1134687 RepID=A0A7H4N147_9ENTR|nr:LOS biosynthesis enzyme LBGB [Klebsiella michiganensis]